MKRDPTAVFIVHSQWHIEGTYSSFSKAFDSAVKLANKELTEQPSYEMKELDDTVIIGETVVISRKEIL